MEKDGARKYYFNFKKELARKATGKYFNKVIFSLENALEDVKRNKRSWEEEENNNIHNTKFIEMIMEMEINTYDSEGIRAIKSITRAYDIDIL